MYTRRSSKLTKGSMAGSQRSPYPNDDSIHGMWEKRHSTALRKSKVTDTVVNTDEESVCDIIDIINGAHNAKHLAKEGEEVHDEGLDSSDEDRHSVSSSIASGPSVLQSSSGRKGSPSQGLCSVCWKLYHKAKKMKAPIVDKLLDNDPESLTCDQWVLIKNWKPSRILNARRKLLTHIHLIKKRLVKNDANQAGRCEREGEPAACSRPHIFLQRNLKRLVRVPLKKGRKRNRRKRARDDFQGSRVAKQQRLNSGHRLLHINNQPSVPNSDSSSFYTNSSQSTSSGFECWSEQEKDGPEDAQTTEAISSSVSLEELTKPQEVKVKPKVPKTTAGFRDLLAQMRGNSSMIIRETHY